MNYENEYKNKDKAALNWMTSLYDGLHGKTKEEAEKFFPELKESEDEKIRKHLISLVKNWDKDGIFSKYTSNPKEIKQILAWLEKQDNPTDINSSEFELRLNKLLKQFETLPKEELVSSLIFYLNVVQNDGNYEAKQI